MPNYKVCNCPRCNHTGVSVAAMHYKETQQWHKSGSFSGSGVGITTGGLGFGVGGGSYSETGEIASKRANEFSKPEPFHVPVAGMVITAFIVVASINLSPALIDMLQSMNPNPDANMVNMRDSFQPMIDFFNHYIAPVIGLGIIGSLVFKLKSAMHHEEELNTIEYPKQLKRYNELRYCENCNSLYDSQNNAEDANEIGMSKMMSIAPMTN
jgi:hypothetical protein